MIAAYAGLHVSDRESPDVDRESMSCLSVKIASVLAIFERVCSASLWFL